MYIITNADTGKVIELSVFPVFLRIEENSDNIYGSDEHTANAVMCNGIVYAIENTVTTDKYEYVTVVSKEPIELALEATLNEERSAAYIDYLSAMTGIDLPDEEEEELEESEEGN